MLIPILALLGLFGESYHEVHHATDSLEIHLRYPARNRYLLHNTLTLTLTNIREDDLSDVTVLFDDHYFRQFANVSFLPEIDEVYRIELQDLRPGEHRTIYIEMDSDSYGMHKGTITFICDGREEVALPLRTFIFP